MVTVTETRTRKLETAADIAGYLGDSYARMATESAFSPGEAVAIAARTGMPADFGVGDVALMLCDLPGNPYCNVLGLMPNGMPLVIQAPTANFAKRAA